MARILVAEDDVSVRGFLERALAMSGHSVTVAEDGALALETLALAEGRFDLLLSDVQMPVMDGIALALAAAGRWPDLPIVLMTGYAHQRERAAELDAIVRTVILKPFSLVDIRRTIAEVLAEATQAPAPSIRSIEMGAA